MKIEKGVNLIPGRYGPGGPGRPPEYPFRVMAIGDSFLATGRVTRNVSTAACNFVRNYRLPWKFTTRSTSKGPRVWRVK